MAGNILEHYYKESGYSLGELAHEHIDNMPYTHSALGNTSVGGVSSIYLELLPLGGDRFKKIRN
jgi:hypothetical protein